MTINLIGLIVLTQISNAVGLAPPPLKRQERSNAEAATSAAESDATQQDRIKSALRSERTKLLEAQHVKGFAIVDPASPSELLINDEEGWPKGWIPVQKLGSHGLQDVAQIPRSALTRLGLPRSDDKDGIVVLQFANGSIMISGATVALVKAWTLKQVERLARVYQIPEQEVSAATRHVEAMTELDLLVAAMQRMQVADPCADESTEECLYDTGLLHALRIPIECDLCRVFRKGDRALVLFSNRALLAGPYTQLIVYDHGEPIYMIDLAYSTGQYADMHGAISDRDFMFMLRAIVTHALSPS